MDQITLFTPTLNDGGMENKTSLLANALFANGWEVRVLVLNNANPVYQLDPGIEVIDLKVKRKAKALLTFIQWARANRPALLYSISTPFNALWILTKLISAYPKKLIVSERNHLSSAVKFSTKLSDKFRPIITRALYPHADSVLCVSESVRQDLLAVSGLDPTKVATLWNMIELQPDQVQAEAVDQEPADGSPLFLAVGRLNKQKDHATLVKAFAKVRENLPARLVILGEGPLRAELTILAADLGVSTDVSMPGFVADPFPYYRAASVVVLPSLFEGLPGVLLEALSAGRTIVATDCPGGSAEILRDGEFGKLVPIGDVKTLADAMLNALDNPADPLRQQQRAADLSVEKLLPKYIEHLKKFTVS